MMTNIDLKRLMSQHGNSNEFIGTVIGKSAWYVCQMRTGKMPISPEVEQKLTDYYNGLENHEQIERAEAPMEAETAAEPAEELTEAPAAAAYEAPKEEPKPEPKPERPHRVDTVSLPPEAAKKLRCYCYLTGRDMAKVMVACIDEYIGKRVAI